MKRILYLISMICVFGVFTYSRSTCLDQNGLNDAQISDWVSNDVRWIITTYEADSFSRLTSVADQKRFIKDFWLRRDPTPETDENEFLIEYCERYAYTAKFTSDIPGSITDMGRIHILWGSPDLIEIGKGRIDGVDDIAYEKWTYNYVFGLGRDISVKFTDTARNNEFCLSKADAAKLEPYFSDLKKGLSSVKQEHADNN
ncbi:MAG: GWxTD domain-containing protein [Acidobacteria bacterium]|nr:GWxTD domain-containing protein [Acidobacteriota bacterium]